LLLLLLLSPFSDNDGFTDGIDFDNIANADDVGFFFLCFVEVEIKMFAVDRGFGGALS